MTVTPQASLYETTIENAELEEALEQRAKLKDKKAAAAKAFKEADDQAKALINAQDLGTEAPVRVGRFVIVRRDVPARSVAFDTDPTTRLQISLLPEAA